jgi:hypothetical protein
MGQRNGLNHKLRGLKGVGWNRALPAPFGFDNAISPDGINDILNIPTFIGKPFYDEFCISFWTKHPITPKDLAGIFRLEATNGVIIIARSQGNGGGLVSISGSSFTIPVQSTKFLVTMNVSLLTGNFTGFVNNDLPYSTNVAGLIARSGVNVNACNFFSSGTFTTGLGTSSVDEFKIYGKHLTHVQHLLDYNYGIGNNPHETEHLNVWYKFEQFENLDFSPLQDGSDMRLGIRDLSNKNNHAQPMNMDTNPSSPNYVLKPF